MYCLTTSRGSSRGPSTCTLGRNRLRRQWIEVLRSVECIATALPLSAVTQLRKQQPQSYSRPPRARRSRLQQRACCGRADIVHCTLTRSQASDSSVKAGRELCEQGSGSVSAHREHTSDDNGIGTRGSRTGGLCSAWRLSCRARVRSTWQVKLMSCGTARQT